MRLEHSFSIPIPRDKAFEVLKDLERVARCLPGAAIDSVDGDEYRGQIRLKVGPVQVSYKGVAEFTELDPIGGRATIVAKANDVRGSGTAQATVAATLEDEAGGTLVGFVTDLDIRGRHAQFGRGVLEEVGIRLLGEFAQCLSDELGRSVSESPSEIPTGSPGPSAGPDGSLGDVRGESLDVFSLVGPIVLRRIAYLGGALAIILILWKVFQARR